MRVTVGGRKAVLVAVDIQNRFYTVTEGLCRSVDAHMGMMNLALDLFHESGSPRSWCCTTP